MMEEAISGAASANAALKEAQRSLQEEISRLNDLRMQIGNLEQQRSTGQEKHEREAPSLMATIRPSPALRRLGRLRD